MFFLLEQHAFLVDPLRYSPNTQVEDERDKQLQCCSNDPFKVLRVCICVYVVWFN